jgi:uncharacterized protein
MARVFLVNAAELLRRPGTRRTVRTELTPEELHLYDARLEPSTPVVIELRLESLSDGIVVEGEIDVRWQGTCRRCLKELAGDLVLAVRELYQTEVTDPDAFPIVGDQLDLEPMARETVLLDLPADPLCSAACAGLCPTCGADRNVAPCECVEEPTDDRWSVLDQLREQLGEPEQSAN